jgi:hypothetical protein
MGLNTQNLPTAINPALFQQASAFISFRCRVQEIAKDNDEVGADMNFSLYSSIYQRVSRLPISDINKRRSVKRAGHPALNGFSKREGNAAGAVRNGRYAWATDGIDNERANGGIIHVLIPELADGIHGNTETLPDEPPQPGWKRALSSTTVNGTIVGSDYIPICAQQIAAANDQLVRLFWLGGKQLLDGPRGVSRIPQGAAPHQGKLADVHRMASLSKHFLQQDRIQKVAIVFDVESSKFPKHGFTIHDTSIPRHEQYKY